MFYCLGTPFNNQIIGDYSYNLLKIDLDLDLTKFDSFNIILNKYNQKGTVYFKYREVYKYYDTLKVIENLTYSKTFKVNVQEVNLLSINDGLLHLLETVNSTVELLNFTDNLDIQQLYILGQNQEISNLDYLKIPIELSNDLYKSDEGGTLVKVRNWCLLNKFFATKYYLDFLSELTSEHNYKLKNHLGHLDVNSLSVMLEEPLLIHRKYHVVNSPIYLRDLIFNTFSSKLLTYYPYYKCDTNPLWWRSWSDTLYFKDSISINEIKKLETLYIGKQKTRYVNRKESKYKQNGKVRTKRKWTI